MKINTEQLQRAIVQYFDSEIVAKATGVKKFTMGLVAELYRPKITSLITSLTNNSLIKMSDIVDENGLINIDQLYNAAKESIKKSGQFILFDIIFNETDVDKLYNIIQQIGG